MFYHIIWYPFIHCAYTIVKTVKTLPQNNWETDTNKHDKEVPKERDKSPEEIQKVMVDIIA